MLPRAVRLRPDIVHCHDTTVLFLGVLVKFLTGAKLIYDAHELESDRNCLGKFEGKLTLLCERILWPFIDALIVVSPSIQKWYSQWIGTKISTVVLNSPSFNFEQKIDHEYLRKKFNIPHDCQIFIYIGILGIGRGLDLLKKAFTDDDVKSHIVFLGFGDYSDELKELSRLNNKIHVHDPVPHTQVVEVAMSADYGLCLIENVSLSDYLCLPNKLFEYCFAGLPVLASNFPDIKKIIDEYGVGECCDLDLNSITSSIKIIEKYRPNYKFKDLTPLSWESQQENLLKLYVQILLKK
jgi:glycosyltransferase involved in cell wall biosynthesis